MDVTEVESITSQLLSRSCHVVENSVSEKGGFSRIYDIIGISEPKCIAKVVDYQDYIIRRYGGHDDKLAFQTMSSSGKAEIESLEKLKACPKVVKYLGSKQYENVSENRYSAVIIEQKYKTLSAYKEEKQLTNEKLFLSVARDIGIALRYMKQADIAILHRDIKPDNIMVDDSGREPHFVLIDFGRSCPISKHSNAAGMTRIWTDGYIAPEIEKGKKNVQVGFNSDIYSLGMTLLWIFSDLDSDIVPKRNKMNSYDIPKAYQKIIRKAIRKNPKIRYEHIEELLMDINKIEDNTISNIEIEQPYKKKKLLFSCLGGGILLLYEHIEELLMDINKIEDNTISNIEIGQPYKKKKLLFSCLGGGILLLLLFIFLQISKSIPIIEPEWPDNLPDPTVTITPVPTIENGSIYKEIEIDNPSWEYYASNLCQPQWNSGLSLQLKESAPNRHHEAIKRNDEEYLYEEWFWENGVDIVEFPYDDGRYSYTIAGDEDSDYILTIIDQLNGSTKVFDFNQFVYPPEVKKGEEDTVYERVMFASISNDILYVEISHLTYAESSKWNAYLVAIDLSSDTLLWKTDPLVSNAKSFAIIDDCIVAGYGYTAEDDYLNIISVYDGKLIETIPIDSQADHIVYDNGLLYVRTYNYDCIYSCEK